MLDFLIIIKAIGIAVGIQWIGPVESDLLPVINTISIAVSIEGVGPMGI